MQFSFILELLYKIIWDFKTLQILKSNPVFYLFNWQHELAGHFFLIVIFNTVLHCFNSAVVCDDVKFMC